MQARTIVYCGELWPGSTCTMRADALRRLGNRLVVVDTTYQPRGVTGLGVRIVKKFGYALDPANVNHSLVAALDCAADRLAVWIDKGVCVTPRTLSRIRQRHPGVVLVNYSPDDMGRRHNQSRQYLASIPLYDLLVTTKSFNVPELKALGARAVLFLNNAYCPILHRPVAVTSEDRLRFGGRVGFIGAFEEDRAENVLHLVRHDVPVRIWGGGWDRWASKNRHPLLRVEERCIWADDYVRAIGSFDINLCFLRRLNRDVQTTRSVEIPACGGFMLAERSAEHLKLFSEHTEAEFFGDEVELLQKCRYYLANEERRVAIARQGRARCEDSDYSYTRHVLTVIEEIDTRFAPMPHGREPSTFGTSDSKGRTVASTKLRA